MRIKPDTPLIEVLRELQPWQRPVQCQLCKDVIYSSWDGQFQTCSCYKNEIGNQGCFVDQTPYYERWGGGGFRHVLTEEELKSYNITIKEKNESK